MRKNIIHIGLILLLAPCYTACSSFLDELKTKPYQRVAIFAHGGVLICAQIYAGLIKAEEAFNALTPYGGIIRIEV